MYGWTGYNLFTFDPIGNPGPQDPFTVDGSHLTGYEVTVAASVTQVGNSNVRILGPIPADFLRQPVATPNTIELIVRTCPPPCPVDCLRLAKSICSRESVCMLGTRPAG